MHDGMPYGWNQGQGQGHSREVDRQSPTGLIFASRHLEAVCHPSELPGLCCWHTNFGSRLQLPCFGFTWIS